MKSISAICAAAALASFAGLANAQITATNPDSILSAFQSEGFPAKMEVDDYGDPLITVRYYGSSFSVYFYGCQQGRDCTAIQFFSGYRTDGSYSVSQANEWNMNNRYARSYVSDAGSARIEYDIFLGRDGVSNAQFSDALDLWLKAMTDFEKYIDW